MFQSRNKNSLRQGEQFSEMRKMYKENIKHIGKNNYNGIKEGLTSKEKMDGYNDDFEITLREYEVAYRKKIERNNVEISEYNGKTIEYGETGAKEIYYVTKKGVVRKLSGNGTDRTNAQRIIDHGCPDVSEDNKNISTEIFKKFTVGPDLKCNDSVIGDNILCQKCQLDTEISGFVKPTGSSGDLYWVNDKGYRQKFKKGVYQSETHFTCPKRGKTIFVPQDRISIMPTNSNPIMNETSACTGFINNDGDKSVTALNNRLIGLAINMKNEISKIEAKSKNTNGNIDIATSSLDAIIANLKTKRETISKLKKEIISLNGNIQDNTHLVKSLNIRYMAWFLSFVTIFLLGLYKIKK
tara:strand:+ start:9927 stop:10988 length:1062 start_codon:yes stop_codon:yes gene_type:complete